MNDFRRGKYDSLHRWCFEKYSEKLRILFIFVFFFLKTSNCYIENMKNMNRMIRKIEKSN